VQWEAEELIPSHNNRFQMVLDDRRDSQHQRKSVILWWGEMGAGTPREGERALDKTVSLALSDNVNSSNEGRKYKYTQKLL